MVKPARFNITLLPLLLFLVFLNILQTFTEYFLPTLISAPLFGFSLPRTHFCNTAHSEWRHNTTSVACLRKAGLRMRRNRTITRISWLNAVWFGRTQTSGKIWIIQVKNTFIFVWLSFDLAIYLPRQNAPQYNSIEDFCLLNRVQQCAVRFP